MVIAYKDEVIFIHNDDAVHIKKYASYLDFVGVNDYLDK